MKKLMIVMLLLGAGAPMPAQLGPDVCNPNSPYYDSSAGLYCVQMMMIRHQRQQLAMATSIATGRRREWAAIDAQHPPVIVDSRPDKRVAPRRMANQSPGAGAKQREAAAEALLNEFESGLRAWPHALLDLPHNHLATAYMLFAVRNYMVMRGLDDVSPELVRESYFRFRRVNRSAEAAKLVANAGDLQFAYEALLIESLSIDADWRAARASGDRAGMGTLRERAEQNLRGLFGETLAEGVRQMDNEERSDRSARRDNRAFWGERTTLRPTAVAAWR